MQLIAKHPFDIFEPLIGSRLHSISKTLTEKRIEMTVSTLTALIICKYKVTPKSSNLLTVLVLLNGASLNFIQVMKSSHRYFPYELSFQQFSSIRWEPTKLIFSCFCKPVVFHQSEEYRKCALNVSIKILEFTSRKLWPTYHRPEVFFHGARWARFPDKQIRIHPTWVTCTENRQKSTNSI